MLKTSPMEQFDVTVLNSVSGGGVVRDVLVNVSPYTSGLISLLKTRLYLRIDIYSIFTL